MSLGVCSQLICVFLYAEVMWMGTSDFQYYNKKLLSGKGLPAIVMQNSQ